MSYIVYVIIGLCRTRVTGTLTCTYILILSQFPVKSTLTAVCFVHAFLLSKKKTIRQTFSTRIFITFFFFRRRLVPHQKYVEKITLNDNVQTILLLYGCSYLMSKASGVRLQPKYYNLWCVCVCVRLSPTERLLTESYRTWAVRSGVVNVSTRRDLYYAYIVFFYALRVRPWWNYGRMNAAKSNWLCWAMFLLVGYCASVLLYYFHPHINIIYNLNTNDLYRLNDWTTST